MTATRLPGSTRARPTLEIDEEQALFFRARRTHLAGPGAADLKAAAVAILGAQAQQENPALLALSLRTIGRPTAAAVRTHLLDAESRCLVRTWGQRDTLHVYSCEDWPLVIASLPEWHQSRRHGGMPKEQNLEIARAAFEAAEGPILRRDLFDLIPRSYLDELADHPAAGNSPERLAATRLVWLLARQGTVCFAHRQGSEQTYAHRDRWLPELDWTEKAQQDAAVELARRYLASFGPATAADMAHFFGARVSAARSWLERLEPELADIVCGGRRGLLALSADLESLRDEPPSSLKDWPIRLLPQWDMHTMTHRDKSWVVPNLDETKLIWRKAGVNAPTVIVRGRLVATWERRVTSRKLSITVSPLGGWRQSYLKPVEREAAQIAAHYGLPDLEVSVAS